MLSKKERVKKKKDFEYIFKKGKNFSNSFFIIKTTENNLSFSRFAFVAPLKIFKKAVEKNKIKRLMREGIKEFIPFIQKGFDIIIISREEAKESNFKDIKNSIKDILKKTGLL